MGAKVKSVLETIKKDTNNNYAKWHLSEDLEKWMCKTGEIWPDEQKPFSSQTNAIQYIYVQKFMNQTRTAAGLPLATTYQINNRFK